MTLGTRPARGIIGSVEDLDAGMSPRAGLALGVGEGPMFEQLAERTPFEPSQMLIARMGRVGSVFSMIVGPASDAYAGEVCVKVRDLSEYNPPAWEPWLFLATRRAAMPRVQDAAMQLTVFRHIRALSEDQLREVVPAMMTLARLRDPLAVPSRLDAVVRLLANAYAIPELQGWSVDP